MLSILLQGEFSVQEMTQILGMGQSRISRHLKILLEAGVIVARREGSWAFYRLRESESELFSVFGPVLEELKASDNFHGFQESISEVLEARRHHSRAFFSRVDTDWDFLDSRYIDRRKYFSEIRRFISTPQVLADLGCGDGSTILELVEEIPRIIGVDNSLERLDTAARNLSEFNNVNLRLGNLEHLPLRDLEADTILAAFVLHHVAQPETVFSEFYRVLKPGGALIIVDYKKHKLETMRKEMGDLWLGFSAEEMQLWCGNARFDDPVIAPLSGGLNDIRLFISKAYKPINTQE